MQYRLLINLTLVDEIKEIGGLETIAGKDVDLVNDTYSVSTPLVIMDDSSFENYCEQIGLNAGSQNKEGCIVLNRIWDNTHSNFRYKRYVPFEQRNSRYHYIKAT